MSESTQLCLWLWNAYWIGRCLAGAVRWWLAARDLRALRERVS
jgi:hypothetical protein